MNWLGLSGWKWLFILEGLPAVVLGIVAFLFLTDRPRDAKWLTPAERAHLEGLLAAEARAKEAAGATTAWQALRMPNVWLLALGIFATNTGGYALAFWMPTTVKHLSHGSRRLRRSALRRTDSESYKRGRLAGYVPRAPRPARRLS